MERMALDGVPVDSDGAEPRPTGARYHGEAWLAGGS